MKHTQTTILKYDAVFEEQEEGGYSVFVPSLPGCISEGDTFEEAKQNIQEAMTVYLESMAMDNEEAPAPDRSVFVGPVSVQWPDNQPSFAI